MPVSMEYSVSKYLPTHINLKYTSTVLVGLQVKATELELGSHSTVTPAVLRDGVRRAVTAVVTAGMLVSQLQSRHWHWHCLSGSAASVPSA